MCSFVAIYQNHVSPVSVVSWGSASTVLGWILWDIWNANAETTGTTVTVSRKHAPGRTRSPHRSSEDPDVGLGLSIATPSSQLFLKPNQPTRSSPSASVGPSPSLSSNSSQFGVAVHHPVRATPSPPRIHRFLATARSALLIYISLLGLSPILKSLTESTSSDSIWAMTCWLMCINVFFFDYSGGLGAVKFPASLSTNAALMASTVLASRLPSTTHVFSLTLFSIEVFGLFPVFRRHLREISWQGHLVLTLALMLGAGASLGIVLSTRPFRQGGWQQALAGAIVWTLGSVIGMGGCSWWLINLQRYKNVVIGPWDPARPVIRASWNA